MAPESGQTIKKFEDAYPIESERKDGDSGKKRAFRPDLFVLLRLLEKLDPDNEHRKPNIEGRKSGALIRLR